MSIAEKLTQIAENEQKVYDAGKRSMVDPAKIIEKTVSGTFISVDDVSEIPHKCTVSADADTNVSVCGKNLIPFPYAMTERTINGVKITIGNDGVIHFKGTATVDFDRTVKSFYLDAGTYTWSTNKSFEGKITIQLLELQSETDSTIKSVLAQLRTLDEYRPQTFTITERKYVRFRILITKGSVFDDDIMVQLEHGCSATPYEPYHLETFTVTPTEPILVDSICPAMSLFTDGAVISFCYHKSWGMQVEQNAFWDAYQQNGSKELCQSAYAYAGWNDTTYNPKHIDKPTNANRMFYESGVTVVKNADFSNCINEDELFRNSKVEDAGVVDTSKTSLLYYTFFSAQDLRILKLILKDNGTQTFNNPFFRNYALVRLLVEGVIGNSGLNFTDAPLDHDSLMSIINALMYVGHTYTKTSTVVEPVGFYPSGQNFAPDWPAYTTTGEKVLCGYDNNAIMCYCCSVDGVYYAVTEATNTATYTITLGATNIAKLEDFEKGIATEKGWTLL